MTSDSATTVDSVGPVLRRGHAADMVIAAIRAENAGVVLLDRGAYLRVLVPHRCLVTRETIEAHLGRPFRLRSELEAIMPAFKGRFRVDDDQALWEFQHARGSR